MTRPLLIYDGECGLCRIGIERWKQMTGEHMDARPFQTVASCYPAVPKNRFSQAVHFVGGDGTVFSGVEAIVRSLACIPGKGWLLKAYQKSALAANVSERCYRFIVKHRKTLSAALTLFLPSGMTPSRIGNL